MISKRINRKVYKMEIESLNDLAGLRFLILNSDIIYFQKRKYKSLQSSKVKIFYERIPMQSISSSIFNKIDNLLIEGYYRGKLIRKTLRIGSKFFIIKRFNQEENAILKDLVPLKTLYLGVGDYCIEWGTIIDYTYKVEQRRYYNIDNLRYTVCEILDILQKSMVKERVYRCCPSFVSMLNSWTHLPWEPLKKDVSLEGHYITKKQIQEQNFISQIIKSKDNWVRKENSLFKELERNNIRKIYINPFLSANIYNKIINKKLNLVYLPYTKQLKDLLPENFLGIRYFEIPECNA